MAHYMADDGHPGLPFTYNMEWLSAGGTYDGNMDQSNNLNQQQSILTQNDTAFMQDFFSNPDGANMAGDLSGLEWDINSNMNYSVGSEQVGGLDEKLNTIDNVAATLASPVDSQYRTSAYGHGMGNTPRMPGVNGGQNTQESDEAWASSALLDMFAHGAKGFARAPTNTAGLSWGAMTDNRAGMHDTNGFTGPLSPASLQSMNLLYPQGSTNAFVTQRQYQDEASQRRQDHFDQWHQQSQHSRHRSLHAGNPNWQTRAPPSPQLNSHIATRPNLVRFGSDNNFSSSGYIAPGEHTPLEYEKGANLNNVPFAAQAAANATPSIRTFTSVAQQGYHPSYTNLPNNTSQYDNSTASSPGLVGGLPLSYLSSGDYSNMQHPGQLFGQTMPRKDDEDGGIPEDEHQVVHAPKRRKGQTKQDEDDSDYDPGRHASANKKRGHRGSKITAADDSDDNDAFVEPTNNKSTGKRRKPLPFNSSRTTSPSTLDSPSTYAPATTAPRPTNKRSARPSSHQATSAPSSRNNLTREERRQNHIASEKTRRDLIKIQYAELDAMVPSLGPNGQNSGLSRSDILSEIVDFAEDVLFGNAQVANQDGDAAAQPGAVVGKGAAQEDDDDEDAAGDDDDDADHDAG